VTPAERVFLQETVRELCSAVFMGDGPGLTDEEQNLIECLYSFVNPSEENEPRLEQRLRKLEHRVNAPLGPAEVLNAITAAILKRSGN
jgi:hypothetical protein